MTKILPKIVLTLCLTIIFVSCVSGVYDEKHLESSSSEIVTKPVATRSVGQVEAVYQKLPNPYELKVM